jgi:hypothetical protein
VCVGGFVYFYNSNSGGGSASRADREPRAGCDGIGAGSRAAPDRLSRGAANAAGTREFKPSLKPKNVDTANIDPTLRLDLLAKLKNVRRGSRNAFAV